MSGYAADAVGVPMAYTTAARWKPVLCIAAGSYLGGAELVTLHAMQGLKSRGADVFCIFNGWNDGAFGARLKRGGIAHRAVKLGWIHRSKPAWTLNSLAHWPAAFVAVWRLRSRLRPGSVYASSYRHVLLLSPLLHGRVVLHVHDMLSVDRQFRALLPWLDRKVTYYVAVSQFILQDLVRCGVSAEKIVTIPNGTPVPELPPEPARGANEPVQFGIVGQVLPHKGHEDLLRALARVRQAGCADFHLTIVGKGDPAFRAELERLAVTLGLQGCVTWRGFRGEMAEIYAGIDVLVVPTRTQEPFGMVAAEAQSLGLPVIAANAGGLAEIIVPGVTGLLFEQKSVAALAAALTEVLICSPERRREMGIAGRRRVEQCFSSELMCERLFQLVALT